MGRRIGYLCVHLDVSVADDVVARLATFTEPQARRPDPLHLNDLRIYIGQLVRDFVREANKPLTALDRSEKVRLVASLHEAGIFQARNAVKLVAQALGMSRGSIYNLLAISRNDADERQDPGCPLRGTQGANSTK
jgi:predicted transcriptional regulator YheO